MPQKGKKLTRYTSKSSSTKKKTEPQTSKSSDKQKNEPTEQNPKCNKSKQSCTKTQTEQHEETKTQDDSTSNLLNTHQPCDTQSENDEKFLDAYDRPIRSQRAKKNYKKKLRKQTISDIVSDNITTQIKYSESSTGIFWPSFQTHVQQEALPSVCEKVQTVEESDLSNNHKDELLKQNQKKQKPEVIETVDEEKTKIKNIESEIVYSKRITSNDSKVEKESDLKPNIESVEKECQLRDSEEFTDTDRYTTAEDLSTSASQSTLDNVDEIVYESVGTRADYIKPEIRSRILNLVTITKKSSEENKSPPNSPKSVSSLTKSMSSTVGNLVKQFEKINKMTYIKESTQEYENINRNISVSEGNIPTAKKHAELTFTEIKKIFSQPKPYKITEETLDEVEEKSEDSEKIESNEIPSEIDYIDAEIEEDIVNMIKEDQKSQESTETCYEAISKNEKKIQPEENKKLVIDELKQQFKIASNEEIVTLKPVIDEVKYNQIRTDESNVQLKIEIETEPIKITDSLADIKEDELNEQSRLETDGENTQLEKEMEFNVDLQINTSVEEASHDEVEFPQYSTDDEFKLQSQLDDEIQSEIEGNDMELELKTNVESEENEDKFNLQSLLETDSEILSETEKESYMKLKSKTDVELTGIEEEFKTKIVNEIENITDSCMQLESENNCELEETKRITINESENQFIPNEIIPDDVVKVETNNTKELVDSTTDTIETKEVQTEPLQSDSIISVLTLHQDMNYSDSSSIDITSLQLNTDQISLDTDPSIPGTSENQTDSADNLKTLENKTEEKPQRPWERTPMPQTPHPYCLFPSTSSGSYIDNSFNKHFQFKQPKYYNQNKLQPPPQLHPHPPPPQPHSHYIMMPPVYPTQYSMDINQQIIPPRLPLLPELAQLCPVLLYNPYTGMSQCYTNINYAMIKQIIFENQIVLNRLTLRADQTLYYFEEDRLRIIRGQHAEHIFHLKYLINDVILTIQHIHNLLSSMVGMELAGPLPYMPSKNMNLLRMKLFCTDVRRVSISVQPIIGKIVKDLFFGEISQNSEMAILWQSDVDELLNSLLSLCSFCNIQSYATIEYTNIQDAVEQVINPINIINPENIANVPSSSTSAAPAVLPVTEVPSIIPNVNELLTDPYMQNMPSTSTDSMSSQWLSTLNANNTFNSDRYNTQFEELTKVNISEADVVPVCNNYQTFQDARDAVLPRNVLEIYDVPSTYVYRDIYSTFYEYLQFYEAKFHRITDTSGLLVLRSVEEANSIKSRPWPRLRVRDMCHASIEAKNKCLILGLKEPDSTKKSETDTEDN